MTLDDLWSLATVPVPGGYTTWPAPYGQMCVTLEDAEMLHSLVRVTKPERVLELGTGYGVSARFIVEALEDNGKGVLWTVEPNDQIREAATKMIGDSPRVYQVKDNTESCGDGFPPDLIFVDSGYRYRQDDIAWALKTSALIVVHDAGRDYEGLRGRGTYLPGSAGLWIGRGDG